MRSLLSWYMARRFFGPFAFGLLLFALIIFLGDMFDKMNWLMKSTAPIGVIMTYLWLEVPYWAVRVVPMATLLATLTALTGFLRSGEWIAVQACGFRARSLFKPLLWCALGIGVLSFAAQETVLPLCYRASRRLWQSRVQPDWGASHFQNVALIAGRDEFIQAALFAPGEGKLERPVLEKRGMTGPLYRLDAQSAVWDGTLQRWVFFGGVERRFENGAMREYPFARAISDLSMPPAGLVPRSPDTDTMSLLELRDYARQEEALGIPLRVVRVAFQRKIAYPFANVVICALGIPVALRLGRASRLVSFSVALGLSFCYLWTMELARALGESGRSPAWLAAWAANLIFGAIAAYGVRRADLSA